MVVGFHGWVDLVKPQVKQASKRQPSSPRPPSGSAPVRLIGGDYEIVNRWPVVVLASLTFFLSLPLFAPASFWLLGFVVFVPWLVAVCISRRSGWVYLVSYLLGAAFFLWHLRWMYHTTPPGYILGSLFWLAPGFPLAAWPVRFLYRQHGWSIAIVFPIIWTAIELLRSRGPLNFPWFLLGHSQIRILTLIQIADLVGVYGVSFLLALVNGWMADLLLRPILIWWGRSATASRRVPIGTVVMVVSLGATIVYGQYRLSQHNQLAEQPESLGPKIAVLQGDFVLSPTYDPKAPTEGDKFRTYRELLERAAAQSPDMLVLPETPWSLYLQKNGEYTEWNPLFTGLATRYSTPLVVGSLRECPQQVGPDAKVCRHNSAFVYTPGVTTPKSYDKIHLVPFGEYVPFRNSERFHWLYRFLNDGPWNPWGAGGHDYSLTPGTEYSVFAMQAKSRQGDAFRFGLTICYEDVVADLFRRFVTDRDGAKRVEFMLNISNDGWFGRGTQQPQHLVSCAFRAVENRIGIARAVNTGVSGFLDSDGSWHDLMVAESESPHAGGTGYRIAPVRINRRVTFYSQYGDVFAYGCTFLAMIAMGTALTTQWRSRRVSRREGKEMVTT